MCNTSIAVPSPSKHEQSMRNRFGTAQVDVSLAPLVRQDCMSGKFVSSLQRFCGFCDCTSDGSLSVAGKTVLVCSLGGAGKAIGAGSGGGGGKGEGVTAVETVKGKAAEAWPVTLDAWGEDPCCP